MLDQSLSFAGAVAANLSGHPYAAPYPGLGRLAKKAHRQVAHQAARPVCGKTMVNIYKREGEWKCRLCWEAVDAVKATEKEGVG